MKKVFIYLLSGIAALSLAGCAAPKKTGIAGIVDDFFESSYEYQKERSVYQDGVESEIITEGKYIASPYQEYVRVVEPAESGVWSEMYISGRGRMVNYVMKTKDGLAKQKAGRSYPYGYGEDLKFTLAREENVDGVTCEVYQTSYTVEIGGGLRSRETLTAVISQEYYIDTDKKQVVMVYTDLTEQNRKTNIVNEMMMKDISAKEAEKNVEDTEYTAYERVKIYNYNGDIQIEKLK